MRIFATVDVLKFESKRYTAAMHAAIDKRMKMAALAFVRAAIVRIPVDTGMAAGSFLHLGRYLGRIGLASGDFVKSYIDGNRRSGTGQFYGPPASKGNPETKNEFTTGRLGLVPRPASQSFVKKGNRHQFEFDIRVFYITLNDLVGSKGTGPWGAFEAGRIAFLVTMRNLKKDFPAIQAFMTKTTISLGRSGLTRVGPVRLRKQEKIQ